MHFATRVKQVTCILRKRRSTGRHVAAAAALSSLSNHHALVLSYFIENVRKNWIPHRKKLDGANVIQDPATNVDDNVRIIEKSV